MIRKLIVLVSLVDFFVNTQVDVTAPPDFVQLVSGNGYSAESHEVITRDGYKLRFYRMTGSPLSPPAPGKPVVILQHGFYSSSDFWVFMDPSDSLSYLLSDSGYDVWVTNIRGNTHGRSHVNLSPNDQAFWNFTLHEMGTIDLPTMIDYILEKTNKPRLTYIGHSMGTTLSYILLSELPEYNKKINYLISLAPVVYFYHTSFTHENRIDLYFIISLTKNLQKVEDYSTEILSQYNNLTEAVRKLCSESYNALCTEVMNNWYKSSGTNFTSAEIKHISRYAPAGTSLKVLEHFRQLIDDGAFKQYDHRSDERNMLAYNSTNPPQYDIRKVTTKVSLIWVHNDKVSNELDVQLLAGNLTNLKSSEPVQSPIFRHADFFFFKGGRKLIQERILELVNQNHEWTDTITDPEPEIIKKTQFDVSFDPVTVSPEITKNTKVHVSSDPITVSPEIMKNTEVYASSDPIIVSPEITKNTQVHVSSDPITVSPEITKNTKVHMFSDPITVSPEITKNTKFHVSSEPKLPTCSSECISFVNPP